MKKQITRITPMQLGKFLAIAYGLLALVLTPIMMISMLMKPGTDMVIALAIGVAMVIAYIGFGFIGGIIGAGIYNLVAGWIGGIEIDLEENIT